MGDEIDGRGKSRVAVDRSLIDARFSEKKVHVMRNFGVCFRCSLPLQVQGQIFMWRYAQ